MKNPFKQENNNGLITAIVIGGAVAAALAYLLLTEDGGELLAEFKDKIKETATDIVSGLMSGKTGISKKTVKTAADAAVK